jgi:hypothetical protein
MEHKMRTLKISLLILILSISISAQAPDTLWSKSYGGPFTDKAFSIEKTSDDGYIFVGSKQTSFIGNDYLWIVKINANGDTLWTKVIGDGEGLHGATIMQLNDDEYILLAAGNINGIGGNFLIKTNSIGDTLWTKYLGDGQRMKNLESTLDGGYILIGTLNFYGISIMKTNSVGDTLWTKQILSDQPQNDSGYDIKKAVDGGYIAAGYNGWSAGAWLIKIDSLGNLEWEKTWTTGIGNTVIQTYDSSFVMSGGSVNHIMLIKSNHIGQIYWFNTYPGSNGYTCLESADKNLIVVGGADGNTSTIILKIDTYGDTLWTKVLDGVSLPDRGSYILQNSDESYMVLGNIYSSPSREEDVMITKLNSENVGVEEITAMESNNFSLFANYPNPFNPSTKIVYKITEVCYVTLKIYDILGREIATLVNQEKPAGEYEVEFSAIGGSASGGNAYNLPSGIYCYQLKAGEYSETRKMVLLK